MKKAKIESIERSFYIPGLEAMVRDGLYQTIEDAKKDLTNLHNKLFKSKRKLSNSL